jgi:hypothetical protein
MQNTRFPLIRLVSSILTPTVKKLSLYKCLINGIQHFDKYIA